MVAPVVPLCTCGHTKDLHPESGPCSVQCLCPAYIELCVGCRHSTEVHNGVAGRCTRIKRDTLQPCGCALYSEDA